MQVMNNRNSKTSITHMVYTETDIHEETHKGKKPLLLRMIDNLLCSVHHLSLSTNSKWGYNLFFNKLQLAESTNSLVSLASTRRKHQLPECSSTNWMEAPTSSHTDTNLYNKEQWFSLAPPYHPRFSGCNQMEATTPCVQAPTWNFEDNSPT
jgi:hypothetical protein